MNLNADTCIDMGGDVLCKRRGSESKEEGIRNIVDSPTLT